ncbi:hypothetical protein [Gramella sp. AN32]|uniref:Photosystem II protein M n=1 Tax=Christiangramia antarctica TaxID=2058158 RepID=A0ABW5X7Z4_9FLAO|nr:hypothetical protein [Gramella sp. AN32]
MEIFTTFFDNYKHSMQGVAFPAQLLITIVFAFVILGVIAAIVNTAIAVF